VCGILCETRNAASAMATVVGIGLNVNQTAAMFVEAGLPDAGSLGLFTASAFDCAEVTRALIRQLDEEYDRLCSGDLATLEACWKWRLGLLGRSVAAECADGTHCGRLREIAFDGLELKSDDGTMLRLVPETVRQLRPA